MKALRVVGLAVLLALALCAPAGAKDPGRWTLAGWSSVSNFYWQGMTSAGPRGPLLFSGPVQGLYRDTRALRQTAGVDPAIPASVAAVEGYNHVGDISYDAAEGGRVLLPLECYQAGGPNGGNTCGHGAIGVADPTTLAFRYYVKLDPAEIPKAMWVEASPDGQLLWTSSGRDLLAYRAADVSAANAAPGVPIRSVRRLAGAAPPTGITGAAFRRGRLFLASAQTTTYEVWSVDLATGSSRVELRLPNVQGESEGLHTTSLLGGDLHFVIAPLASKPTYGPTVGILHFAPGPQFGRGLRVRARAKPRRSLRPRVSVRVTRRGRPVEGATVSVAGRSALTDPRGRATARPALGTPGSFAALARKGRLRGHSAFLRFGPASPAATGSAVPLR